jgi:hypothetical protein
MLFPGLGRGGDGVMGWPIVRDRNVLDFHEGKTIETKCKMMKHSVNLPKSQRYIKSCMNIRVQ